MRMLQSRTKGFEQDLVAILAQRQGEMAGVEEQVRGIIAGVRQKLYTL